jgi:hypothetical protein
MAGSRKPTPRTGPPATSGSADAAVRDLDVSLADFDEGFGALAQPIAAPASRLVAPRPLAPTLPRAAPSGVARVRRVLEIAGGGRAGRGARCRGAGEADPSQSASAVREGSAETNIADSARSPPGGFQMR